ncbi:16S rRNA (guanine(527)-N(7))-methyltransferase RsmG, partial [candidate division FCPU426 bacterium]|nr:16S rRNA (guanine(527)-N(7))-methyltransferase RsmG [candidate division FCPU426 bacterium]
MAGHQYFSRALDIWGISYTEETLDVFHHYYQLLIQWNKRMNLTSITAIHDVYFKHFLDSISSSCIVSYSNQYVVDMGTGAGFPGLPLKILYPHLKVVFVDSSQKKIKALKEICKDLNINNCEFVADNVENMGRGSFRAAFDVVITRALSSLNVIIELGIPLLKINGKLIAYKGPNVEKEVENSYKALNVLNALIIKNLEIKVPFAEFKRRIIIVEKQAQTVH